MWKKVDITKYPFNLLDEIWAKNKEAQILMNIFSDELGELNLEFFDSETSSPPPIPDELKKYCPVEDQDKDWWPSQINWFGAEWQTWFYLNLSFIVTGYRNPKLGGGWNLIEFEGLLPIFTRPAKN
tara:strand:- start:3147 stop:3524 length:378 start_codon:yes stop_codon:yes gene_type:complete